MAGRYGCSNGDGAVRLCSAVAYRSSGAVGVRLRAIGSSARKADELGCAAAQEDSTGFY